VKFLARKSNAHRTIELHIGEIAELFDEFDPCPFHERGLDAAAEEYIVESAGELRGPPGALVFHIDRLQAGADDARIVAAAIHRHFAREAEIVGRNLRALLRRGWISLLIGLAFLFALLSVSEAAGESSVLGALAPVLKESLIIGGWVAMWRPLEIFLYDWWPLAGERRSYRALSRIPVRIQAKAHSTHVQSWRPQ
jgi:hypothetical protein